MSNKLEKYGYTDFYKTQIEKLDLRDTGLIPARIIEVHREIYTIVTDEGETTARLKGSLFYNNNQNSIYPAIGDFVLVYHNDCGDDIIYTVLERKSKFSRLDTFYETEQVVATNFDYVFIMTSLNHDFNIKRLERYLSISLQSGAIPIIILTKADLCSDYDAYKRELEKIVDGIPIVVISSLTGYGIDELKTYIKPTKTIVFLGSSGIGKSSLVNAISGEEIMKVSSIRESDSRGRHTTTHRELIMLENGTMIIDTPGMRVLGMWESSDGVNTVFDDIETLINKCRFNNCNHKSEPGCAIKEALENGELSVERWNNYIKLKKESKFAKRKEKQKSTEKSKSLVKGNKKKKYNKEELKESLELL
ncbi:ribosome biogenesis GTPase [Clostridium cavendishii DSM 21758]|uniref:Small ribosomal subunit biogenesis GTPase RsgA n=1 Tax=Clostridium cavendishii DSM 21758 TaxID=1121302 RepID=A0A1M6FC04_9CLOT|nr:ribosome small subunit-dependent GTPase A [Clostridium cavendishii]SHI95149.1 ribosome biogenesis GTPase [Clostridium cavendishii DSM 21758]